METIEEFADDMKSVVGAKIRRVGFGDAHHMRVGDIGSAQDAYLFPFGDGEFFQIFVRHFPQGVGLIAEVLEADPGLAGVGDHVGAPVVEDLQPPYQYIRLLNVNPVVLEWTPVGFADRQVVNQKSHGNKIAVLQAVAYLAHVAGDWGVHGVDEFTYRHGGEDIVRIEAAPLASVADRLHRGDRITLDEQPGCAPTEKNLSALLANLVAWVFPNRTRPLFR